MRIGFYAPLKAPDHPIPSGDRQMARLLMKAIVAAGHEIELISRLRGYLPDGGDEGFHALARAARREVETIAARWRRDGQTPDLLFAYHPYYKSPDLIAYPLADHFALPYVTAEASHARKRAIGPWALSHATVERAIHAAAAHFCFTPTDRSGLAHDIGEDRLIDLPPFIDAAAFTASDRAQVASTVSLVTVAMMRPGDKMRSYAFLAEALKIVASLDWRLTIVGDGPARPEVEAAFSAVPQSRVTWRGALDSAGVIAALQEADLFVWPGFNEAYGLSYLEAQACGLPAVAVAGQGTPSVILDGRTGRLTSPDLDDFAMALMTLISDRSARLQMGQEATLFVHCERHLPGAAARLDRTFRTLAGMST